MKTDKLVAGENLRKLDPPLIFGEAFEALWTKKGQHCCEDSQEQLPHQPGIYDRVKFRRNPEIWW